MFWFFEIGFRWICHLSRAGFKLMEILCPCLWASAGNRSECLRSPLQATRWFLNLTVLKQCLSSLPIMYCFVNGTGFCTQDTVSLQVLHTQVAKGCLLQLGCIHWYLQTSRVRTEPRVDQEPEKTCNAKCKAARSGRNPCDRLSQATGNRKGKGES